MSEGAPRRAVRVPDDLWAAAAAQAAREDITLSQLIRRWLTDDVANGDYLAAGRQLAGKVEDHTDAKSS
jgi:hypothetical protein